ncbi:MAG: 2-phosphosulfolactate phosphatase [Planctomycetaceae bacterium]|nr:2-phosphosulfolactate phosphatase [Planctomycetaceae bacterium]
MIYTHLLPSHFSPEQLSGGVAVVIDILRASSTISTAIANGAETVIPCEQVEQTHQLRKEITNSPTLLGGERGGVIIEGFDLGNSPKDYSCEQVSGKTVLFTTTNGTRAIHRCQQANAVYIGSFLNLKSITQKLQQHTEPIHLVCAGTDGVITSEDCLFAGAVAAELTQLTEQESNDVLFDDATQLCITLYRQWVAAGEKQLQITEAFKHSQGGRNLLALGMESDLSLCAQLNTANVVPVWDRETNRINALNKS